MVLTYIPYIRAQVATRKMTQSALTLDAISTSGFVFYVGGGQVHCISDATATSTRALFILVYLERGIEGCSVMLYNVFFV